MTCWSSKQPSVQIKPCQLEGLPSDNRMSAFKIWKQANSSHKGVNVEIYCLDWARQHFCSAGTNRQVGEIRKLVGEVIIWGESFEEIHKM